MADDDTRLEDDLAELTRTVEQLRGQLQRQRRPLLTPRVPDLREFTTDVAIPGLVLLLETNVRALKLLQRTLRMAEDREDRRSEPVSERAGEVGATALAQLEGALEEIQSTLAGTPPDSDARELLDDARALQADIRDRLSDDDLESLDTGPSVDVEAELRSIREQLDDGNDQS